MRAVSSKRLFADRNFRLYTIASVLSCRTPPEARRMSMGSGLLTMAFMVPPLLVGMAGLFQTALRKELKMCKSVWAWMQRVRFIHFPNGEQNMWQMRLQLVTLQ